MKLTHSRAAIALAVSASSSFADTFASSLNLGAGNTRFGRDDAVGSFVDTYDFTLVGISYLISSTASSAAVGDQDLDFTSLVIKNDADAIVATYAGNLGTDDNEFYSLTKTLLAAGNYRLVISGVNSASQASYSGNLAIAPAVPEPSTYALLLGGIGAIGLFVRRRSMR